MNVGVIMPMTGIAMIQKLGSKKFIQPRKGICEAKTYIMSVWLCLTDHMLSKFMP
jgi:hypothetical protein